MCVDYGWLHRVWSLGNLVANRGWCMCGVLVGFSISIPSLASKLGILFPIMLAYAHTLWM